MQILNITQYSQSDDSTLTDKTTHHFVLLILIINIYMHLLIFCRMLYVSPKCQHQKFCYRWNHKYCDLSPLNTSHNHQSNENRKKKKRRSFIHVHDAVKYRCTVIHKYLPIISSASLTGLQFWLNATYHIASTKYCL